MQPCRLHQRRKNLRSRSRRRKDLKIDYRTVKESSIQLQWRKRQARVIPRGRAVNMRRLFFQLWLESDLIRTRGKELPLTGVEGVDLANLALLMSSILGVRPGCNVLPDVPALSRSLSGLAVLGVAIIVGGAFLKNESIGGIGIERLRRLEERFSVGESAFAPTVALRCSGGLRTIDSTSSAVVRGILLV